MKTLYTILVASLFLSLQLKAQAPNQLNYQGVARNASGTVLPNQAIGLRFTIHQGTTTGTIVYQETQATTTNLLGLFTVAIGGGTVVTGTFSAIAWGVNLEYLQVEMDPTGGTSYLNMGTNQFLSVPYALNAGSSSSSWSLTGNATTAYTFSGTPTYNVIGTTSSGSSGFQFGVSGANAGRVENASFGNTALGYQSLNTETAAGANTAIGYQALKANSSGTFNTAVGHSAMGSGSAAGNDNVGIGYQTLVNNTGSSNTGVGASALNGSLSGNNNTGMGRYSMGNTTSGANNSGLGYNSNISPGTLTDATAIGANAEATVSNALILGGVSGVNTQPSGTYVNVGIGTTAPVRELEIGGNVAGVSTIRMDALATGGNFITTPSAATDKVMYADVNGDVRAITPGSSGSVLTLTGGVPTWAPGASSGWSLTGNSGTTAGTNFIGTTDGVDFVFKTNGTEHLRIANSTGNVGIGVTIPAQPLDVAGNLQFSKALMANTDPGASGDILESQGPNTPPIWTTITALAGGGDNWGSQVAITDSVATSGTTNSLNGNGTSLHPLKIVPGSTSGQVLTWNGTTWAPATAASGWSLSGNATSTYTFNASPTTYIGTTAAGGTGFQFGAAGANAGRIESANFGNTALGYQSLNTEMAPGENTAIGYQALKANSSGTANTAIGYSAMGSGVAAGNNNVGIGFQALQTNTGGGNTGVGSGALNNASLSGSDNVAIGQYAMGNNTSGAKNTGLGWNANVSTGALTNATAVGANAEATVSNSLILGGVSGVNTQPSGTYVNVGIGTTAPARELEIGGNVAGVSTIRMDALATGGTFITTPSASTDKIMYADVNGDIRAITPGTANSVLTLSASGVPTWGAATGGASAWLLAGTTTGAYTFSASPTTYVGTTATGGTGFQFGAAGANAGRIESANFGNTALGYQALNTETGTGANTAIGYQALKANSSGTYNTAIGYTAMGSGVAAGSDNIAIGYQTLLNNTGSNNTGVGTGALNGSLSGNNNVALGRYSMGAVSSGASNTGLGYNTNISPGTLSNATAIGANAEATQSNTLVLGAVTGTNGGTSVNVGIGTTAPNSTLQVSGSIATMLVTQTGNYTLTASDAIVLANATTAALTVTLPTASGIIGRQYTIKKIDVSANVVTIATTSGTIDGITTYLLPAQWKYVTVVSDGANWEIVANN